MLVVDNSGRLKSASTLLLEAVMVVVAPRGEQISQLPETARELATWKVVRMGVGLTGRLANLARVSRFCPVTGRPAICARFFLRPCSRYFCTNEHEK